MIAILFLLLCRTNCPAESLKLKGDSISLSRNNVDIFCMSISSSLQCDDKIFPETPREDLYHVGVSITVPRGLLSNSHASHVPHFHHLQLPRGFQMSYCHQQPFVKQPPVQGFLTVSRAMQHGHTVAPALQTPPPACTASQHLLTTSQKAKLRPDSPCLNCSKWFRARGMVSNGLQRGFFWRWLQAARAACKRQVPGRGQSFWGMGAFFKLRQKNGDGLKNIICVLEQVQPGWPASVGKCCVLLPDHGDRSQSWLFCITAFTSVYLNPYRKTFICFLYHLSKTQKSLFFSCFFLGSMSRWKAELANSERWSAPKLQETFASSCEKDVAPQ